MNARQKTKKLKKEIKKLQSDNDLMRRIIADNPTMQELYDAFNKPPLNATYSTILFQKLKSTRFLSPDKPYDAGFIAIAKHGLESDLFEIIKKHITYEIDADCMVPTITASIFIGRK